VANELKHGSVGTELTQAEWEGIGTHVVANQAVGDLIYASTTSQLRRLAISGTATHILSISGGIPAWAAPAAAAAGSLTGSTLASGVTASSLTSVGTVTSGIWNAGAVTSSGAVTGASLVADLTTLDANTLSTSSGNLTISAATGADVLIGDNETLIYVDGGFNTLGFWSVGVNSVQAYFEFDGITMPANTSADRMRLTWGGAMVIPSGTTALAGTLNIEEPNLTATGTVTNAYTVRINNAPSEGGTGNYALWVAAGASRFDGVILASGGSSGAPGISFNDDTDLGFYRVTSNIIGAQMNQMRAGSNGSAGQPFYSFDDANTGMYRAGADLLGFASGGTLALSVAAATVSLPTVGTDLDINQGYIQMDEMTAPGAGAANHVRIYAVVDGGSLTDLAAVFQDGTVDIFAQEV